MDNIISMTDMLTGFSDIEGVVHHEFFRQGQTVNRWCYFEVLKRLRENARSGATTLGSSIMTMRQLMHRYEFIILAGEIKSEPELGQVNRVAEEAQLYSSSPKSQIR
jgi:hypothetical protein